MTRMWRNPGFRWVGSWTAACTLAIVLISSANAAIVRVPADYPTIQEALDAAEEFDEVVVAPGVYSENLVFPGFDLTLRSEDPAASAIVEGTVIDGLGKGPVVVLEGSETELTGIRGLTIKRGAEFSADGGGGILGNGSHASITGNRFEENTTYFGGAIREVDGPITGNVFFHNRSVIDGGALWNCDGDITANFFRLNSSGNVLPIISPTAGGAIYGGAGLIANNVFVANRARGNTTAGTNPFVYEGRGGAIAGTVGAVIANNTFYDSWGRVVLNPTTGSTVNWTVADIADSVFVNNIVRYEDGSLGPFSLDVFGQGSTVEYNLFEYWEGGGTGNFYSDPLFVNPSEQNFRLLPGSPGIDAGRAVDEVSDDFDGVSRPVPGGIGEPGGDGSGYDIGAFEFRPGDTFAVY